MSIPADYISDLLNELSQGRLGNLITQADARRILQEVKEIPENYPDFDPLLTEKGNAHRVCVALLWLFLDGRIKQQFYHHRKFINIRKGW